MTKYKTYFVVRNPMGDEDITVDAFNVDAENKDAAYKWCISNDYAYLFIGDALTQDELEDEEAALEEEGGFETPIEVYSTNEESFNIFLN